MTAAAPSAPSVVNATSPTVLPSIDLVEWEGRVALLPAERDSVLMLQDIFSDLPLPEKFNSNIAYTSRADEEMVQMPVQNPSSIEKKVTLTDAIETNQQFLNWYSIIEEEMDQGQADVYRSHLATLSAYRSTCDDLLSLIADAREKLASQDSNFNFVSSKTASLKHACEALLSEQEHLAEVAEEVHDRLRKFDVLEPAIKLFSASGDLVCLDADFVPMLARLDDSLAFVQKNRTYKDAELFLMKFRQCITRGLTLIKLYFVGVMKSLLDDIKEKLSDRQANDILPKSLQLSLLYARFKRQVDLLRPLIFEIEVRVPGHTEYLGLLNECLSAYFWVRRSLLTPFLTQAVSEITEDTSILSTAKKGAAYMMSLCSDECTLFYMFFEMGDVSLGEFLDSLSSALYDHIRPMILREVRIDILSELCRSLQLHLDAFKSLTYSSSAGGEDEVDDGVDIDKKIHSIPGKDASVRRVVDRVLMDAQSRLSFRAQQYIKEEIEGFKPRDRELEVFARTEKLPLPNSTAVSNMVPDLATAGLVTAPVITSPLVPSPTAPTQDDDRVVTYGIVYGGGEWFPTLQKCLYILGKMYRALPATIFEDLAQESIELCRKSLVSASDIISKKKTRQDGQFFLIKNLFMLREQIAPFESNFVRQEETVDFTAMAETFFTLLRSGLRGAFGTSLPATSNLSVSQSYFPVPRISMKSTDAKAAVNFELKRVCEDLILETARASADPVASFMIKVTAFRLRSERAGSASVGRLGAQGFASVAKCFEVVKAFKDSTIERLGPTVKKMSEYIGDKRTEAVLVLHMKSNIMDAYTSFHNLITAEHGSAAIEAGIVSITDMGAFVDDLCEKSVRTAK